MACYNEQEKNNYTTTKDRKQGQSMQKVVTTIHGKLNGKYTSWSGGVACEIDAPAPS
jgi:hypothetical protein